VNSRLPGFEQLTAAVTRRLRRLVRAALPAAVLASSLTGGQVQAAPSVLALPPATSAAAAQPGQAANELPTTVVTIPARIAVLDTGIDAGHPDLAGKVVDGASFTGGNPMSDANGHGTALASIALGNGAADPGQAVLLSVQVLAPDGKARDEDVVAGVRWAADNRANVILMGFSSPDYSPALAEAISYAWGKGAVLVAAAGNDGSATARYPAAMDHVIGVAATDQDDKLAPLSNTASAAVAALGVNVSAAASGGGQELISGTSPAAAEAAGLAARLLFAGQTNEVASNQLRGGTKVLDGQPFGRVDVGRALGSLVRSAPVSAASLLAPPAPVVAPVYQANADGTGTMIVSPGVVAKSALTTATTLTFTYTAGTGGITSGSVTLTAPTAVANVSPGWSAPTAGNSSASGGAGCTIGAATFSVQFMSVPVPSCSAGSSFTLTYAGTAS